MAMELDDALRALAATQYAVVARRQARALGATPSAMRNRLNGPDWELATPRVLRLVGAPRGIRQELMIAVLDAGPGAAVSHRAAAALWRLPGFAFDAAEVSLRRGVSGAASHAAIVHRPSLLPPSHVTERHGIPVTTLSRTLFDVAGGLRPGRLERVVDTVVAKSPATLLALRALLTELGAPGRPGVATMRAVLSERPDGYVATASGLEARFAHPRRRRRAAAEPVRSTSAATTGSAGWTSSTAPGGSWSRWTATSTTPAHSTASTIDGGTTRSSPPAGTR